MTLRLPDKWIWDFWLAQDDHDYHIFYLQAPRSLREESLRHWNVSIGHAVSSDLQHWRILPDALYPATNREAWDDFTTWTGSIIRHDVCWYLFYTGGARAEDGLVQRIGVATSSDLIHWERHPTNPVMEVDPHWYEPLDLTLWHDQAWRDPWVFWHPKQKDYHAFITARVNHGPADGRGVIAHARSDDLIHWEVLPPVTQPGDFGHMEVPQLVHIQERYYLIFSTTASMYSAKLKAQSSQQPLTGIHYLVSNNPLGPFLPSTHNIILGDTIGSHYSGKLVANQDGQWVLLAARMFTPQGDFIGELSDPFPVQIEEDGHLCVEKVR